MAACPNCGHERDSRFCPQCGQNDRDYTRSLWRLIADVIKEAFEVDGRLPRTLRPMFLRPGQLAAEFSRNRRASYIAPIRSYLFASILFFFVTGLAASAAFEPGGAAASKGVAQQRDAARAERRARWREEDQTPVVDIDVDVGTACEDAGVQRLRRALAPRQRGMMDEILAREGRMMGSKASLCGMMQGLTTDWWDWLDWQEDTTSDSGSIATAAPAAPQAGEASDGEEDDFGTGRTFLAGAIVEVLHDQRAAARQLLDNLPLAMFVTLPAYALLLKLFFVSSRRYYAEHFIFAIHLHTFSFLVYTAMLLLPDYSDSPGGHAGVLGQVVELVFWGLFAWVTAYSYLALRRYYRNGRVVTAFKWFVLGGCYVVLLIPGLFFAVAATVVSL